MSVVLLFLRKWNKWYRVLRYRKEPSFATIRQRAREIHSERGDHVCDWDNYLDEWLQAECELQEKYNKSSGE